MEQEKLEKIKEKCNEIEQTFDKNTQSTLTSKFYEFRQELLKQLKDAVWENYKLNKEVKK